MRFSDCWLGSQGSVMDAKHGARKVVLLSTILAVASFSACLATQTDGDSASDGRGLGDLPLRTHTRRELVDDEGNDLNSATALTHRT
jgi:hypothetical protein